MVFYSYLDWEFWVFYTHTFTQIEIFSRYTLTQPIYSLENCHIPLKLSWYNKIDIPGQHQLVPAAVLQVLVGFNSTPTYTKSYLQEESL